MTSKRKLASNVIIAWAFIHFSLTISGQTIDSSRTKNVAISWELALGETQFTNSKVARNNVNIDDQPLSFHYYVSAKMNLGRMGQNSNFFLKAGIGPNLKTFGLNQTIKVANDKLLFVDFAKGNNLSYSVFQQLFVDIPVMLSYESNYSQKGRNISFEMGGILGVEVYNRWKTHELNNNITTIQYEEDLPQTQPFHYGSSIKIATNKKRGPFTTSFFASGSYFFSNVFKSTNNTPTQSYTISLGLALTLDNLKK